MTQRRTKSLLRPIPRERAPRPLTNCHSVNIGTEYTREELEVLKAVDRYKRYVNRFPSVIEVLDVLRDLGWRPPEK